MTAIAQKSERLVWLERKREAIGASEVAALLGLSPWKSPYALWAEKTGAVPIDETESEWQRWGVLLEPIVCDEYARETGRKVVDHGRYASRVSATCPHLSATLDREVIDDARGPGVLEAKNVSAWKQGDWEDGAPLLYQVQIQAQLEVTGHRWGSAAALVGGNTFRWCDVERDDAFIEMMRRKVAEFWQLVEKRTPPPVDGSQSTAEVLRRLYPNDSGETVALDGVAMTWRDEMEQADAEIKAATERKNAAKNQVIAAIGDATFGVLPDGERFSFKQTTRKESITKASTFRTLRRHAK